MTPGFWQDEIRRSGDDILDMKTKITNKRIKKWKDAQGRTSATVARKPGGLATGA
jgi:hypothetical protein